ncbi:MULTISPECIES: class II fructose-bisphosphate aldolase [Streptomyces]|uniref:Ketose-bisphosphate aldolase n=1 Tax=Streptomyces aureus TaxID=193461 RepID=A0ABV4SWC6_9ACTN|nr:MULTISPECIES: class II fructose-bisphosphate aldolase [unclassified Streptomyces]RFC76823.1 ketose-bisphosphate aldolase [Streptomyces sp. AcE210]WSD99836.1 class II fructose-bisphosphate aldolase family protein [Streptomyces sp. NBC_01474]WSE09026.1 class II fructose-bisphosphate aldolase family protein [Streptomyces sp. NBC_01445]
MPLAATGALVAEATAARTAVAAFNVITLEHIEAVVAGAEAANAPVILQVSENAVRYRYGRLLPLARAAAATAEASSVPVALHLDHVQSDELLRQAADAGFSSVMYDAARLPYDENLAATRAAADWGHANGLWVEAELGEVGGKDGSAPLDAHAPGARTDPGEARAYVTDSGVDALAVAIGSSHAMTTRTATLDHDLLKQLSEGLDVPLVLHGSSGVGDDELSQAVRGGIAKVNVGTALNIAMTAAIREFLAAHPDAVDSRKYLSVGREAMARTVTELVEVMRR